MKKYLAPLLILLISFASIGALSLYTPYLDALEGRSYDFMLAVLRGPQEPPPDIAIVAIDNPSIQEFSEHFSWPWPRSVHALLIDALNRAGARAIVFDVIFDLETDPLEDRELARAIRESRAPVILAATLEVIDDPRFRMVQQVYPIDLFLEAGAEVGFATLNPDRDGVLRAGRLSIGGASTLAVQAYETLHGPLDSARIPIASFEGEDPQILINYVGGARSIPTVSYYQAIEPEEYLRAGVFRDKIVLVGRSLAIQDLGEGRTEKDHFSSPFDLLGAVASISGVEIHAGILNTLLRGNFISRSSPLETWAFLVVFGLLITFIVTAFNSFRLKMLCSFAVIAGAVGVAYAVFLAWNHWLYVIQPTAVTLTVFGLNALYQYYQSERERAHIRRALSGYVSKEVMAEILKDPGKLELGGVQVEATVLFSDIAGFSKLSEGITPRELAGLLNDFFTRVGDAIMKREGMINKYIGDAVMAIWNAPLPNENHALLACLAALEMKRVVAEMAPLKVRIGINTGPMVAGNLGHRERMEYTVIGDAVNLASRLEGANKALGTTILISESIEHLVRGRLLLRRVDCIRVLGKAKPAWVYEVLASGEEAIPESLREMVESFELAQRHYEARDWRRTCLLLAEHLERFPEDGVARIYLERCRVFCEQPPPVEWDGVYALETK